MLIVWFFVYKKLAQFAVRGALPPRRSESPGCAADNKPSCVLHLLGSFIGSRGFSSLEQRPEFWVLQYSIYFYLTYFIQHNAHQVHPCWCNFILFYGQVVVLCVCVCVCVCVFVSHIFFIHSLVDGQLGLLCTLAIVNNVSRNTGVHIFFSNQGLFF